MNPEETEVKNNKDNPSMMGRPIDPDIKRASLIIASIITAIYFFPGFISSYKSGWLLFYVILFVLIGIPAFIVCFAIFAFLFSIIRTIVKWFHKK